MDEKFLVELRDCFTAGYTFPQYCIDNQIKKPLFVSEKKFLDFIWQVYVQFHYDKRIFARFCFIDSGKAEESFTCHPGIDGILKYRNVSDINLNSFDGIILLTKEMLNCTDKTISLTDLIGFFRKKTFVEIPLSKFLFLHPQVNLILTKLPSIERFKGGKEFNSTLWEADELANAIVNSGGNHIETPLDKFGYTNEQVAELILSSKIKRNADGTSSMLDGNYPLRRIQNGKRATAYQPEHFQNRIYFFGSCHHYGVNAPFDKTIESYLQQMLNENNLPYRVENESQHFAHRYQDIFYNLNKIIPSPGDIIFFWIFDEESNDNNIPFFDVSDAFDPPYDFREIYCRKGHVNELGYKLLAKKHFEYLTENNFFRDVKFNYPLFPPPPYHRYGIPPWAEQGGVKSTVVNEELESYKEQLKAKRAKIGALVMNCNPFTLGHQYLVEYAAVRVDKLYIFVVEEDKSEFPFADRIELVRQGVKDFSNVEVLPSGKFIISQTTFSGYFNKAELQDVAVDSSEDVEIFGREIAPTLGITVRFAGEEPTDNVTRQYNETMKEILPRYGVEFCEIPRKEIDGEPISASKVREALKRSDFDKIKNLVPESTFNYLCKHQSDFRRYFTARIDVKLMSTEGDFQILSVSDNNATIWKPAWLQKDDGIGYQIQSYAEQLKFVAKATADGQIQLWLRGVDVHDPNDKSKRIPYWIDYNKLTINGNVILDKITPAWHNKPYHYNMDAKAGEEIKIEIEWLPHNT